MADIDYPPSLRGAIQASKNRGQAAGFRQSDPAGGPPFFEAFSDDVPTIWTFNLVFKRKDAAYFWSWVKSGISNGRAFFNMNLTTEYDAVIGTQAQEVHFTTNGFPQLTSETADVLTYACEVIAREIANTVSDDLIFQFFDLYDGDEDQLKALDIAINIAWPQ